MVNRLYVKNSLFEGWGTEVGYFPNEIFPIQIKLDEPDEDSHSLKRVGKEDIIKREEK